MIQMTRVCLAGATGWVGRGLAPAIASAHDLELVGAVARGGAGKPLSELIGDPHLTVRVSESVEEALTVPCDVLVDYTSPGAVRAHTLAAIARRTHVVIGTSGLTEKDFVAIDEAARKQKVGVLAAGNFAVTAVLLQRFAEIAAKQVPHWEIIDYGKAVKPDAPSGTARELAARLAKGGRPSLAHPIEETHGAREARGAQLEGTPMHSVRLPGFVSSIEVLFGLPDERLSIRHDSGSGAGPYIAGTLLAIRRVGSFVGVKRGLDSVMDL